MTSTAPSTPVPIAVAYGLDRTASRLVLARSLRGRPAAVLYDGAPDAPKAAAALAAARADVLAGKAALAIAAPPAATFIRELKTPIAAPDKAARIWASLLDLELPFPVEQAAVFAAPPRKVPEGGLATHAAAIRADDLQAALDAADAADIPATHVDALAPALYNALSRTTPPARADAERAVVWIDDAFVAVARGTGTTFRGAHLWRSSPLAAGGPAAFLPLWQARADAYLERPVGDAPLDVYFAGPGAADTALVAQLTAALPGAVRTAGVAAPRTFLAESLACRAAVGQTWQLRVAPVAPHPAWAARLALLARRYAWAAALLAALVLLLDAFVLARRSATLRNASDRIAEVAATATTSRLPRGQEPLLLRREVDASKDAFADIERLTAPDAARARLRDLLDALADYDVRIRSLATDANGSFLLEGAAAAPMAPSLLAEALSSRGWDVQSSPAPASVAASSATHPHNFTLKGTPAP